MKKLLTLALALIMALSCAVASAETAVYTQLDIDRDVAKDLMTAFGVEEDQIATIDPILALLSALGVKVTVAGAEGQVDIDLNGTNAVSVGYAMDEAGLSLASTLFPNYVVTASNETIAAMMEQAMANMPGAAGGSDMAATAEALGGYFAKYMEACASAAELGEPVTGEYEYEGYVFDTFVPVTVDMDKIAAAMETLIDEMMSDEAVVGMIQGAMQSRGVEFDPEEVKSGFGEWKEHMPSAVTALHYCFSDGRPEFYQEGEAYNEGRTDAAYRYQMLYEGENAVSMRLWAYEFDMEMGFEYDADGVRADFKMAGMYFGFDLKIGDGDAPAFDCDIYVMNDQKPLLCVQVAISADGAITLPATKDGKTALAVEDLMNDESGEAAQGLLGDVMSNGLMGLISVISEAVPEASALLGMLMGGGMAMAG